MTADPVVVGLGFLLAAVVLEALESQERLRHWARIAAAVVIMAIVWGYLLSYFRPSLLLLNTMDAGGDTPSFHRPIKHLRDTLLPAGNLQGWDLGNFAGYAPYQFYFLPPAILIVTLSWLGVPFFV